MNEAAFQAFYRQTAPVLWAYIRRACGDASLADDILQEAFFRFLRADLPVSSPSGATDGTQVFHAKAYLYRIANSLLADHWRRVKRERRWSLAALFTGSAERVRETAGDAMAVYQQLKPRDQTLLWLAYVEGFQHSEIAAALQLSEKSVRVLLFRARRKLAGLLAKHGIRPESA
jgi:RNA polymerase sigma-70 factor (ECF subfamily)